ncbi:MAG: B12-binding domain-containing radical SAM protein [Planctomycetes bacterium RBG_13_60_9]|nr:MAG: B12-binding domain-containing radical SAM protein [Planctomycetes bacterium RBG_13_60_9]
MKILLVCPECPETFWSFKHALRIISRKALLPPLGLLTVAAMLPPSWRKKLVDLGVEPLRDEDIRWADYVFVSAMRIHKESVDKIVARCRRLGARIVAGGPLFTAGYEHAREIDHLVLDEAEITLPAFLKDLGEGHPQPVYTAHQRADLKDTPIPLWDLVNMKKYACMPIQHSRGCPFCCDFCDVTRLFGNRMRVKATDQILAELESLYVRGWRDSVFVVDDNFIGNKKELKEEVLPAMIGWMERRNHPFVLSTQASINLSDDEELMRLMVRAGFDTVFVGIETPDDRCLAECHKSQNRNRDLAASVRKMQSFGLQVQAGFILGFDSDTPSIFTSLAHFIQESGIVTAMVGLLNAPVGTKLYERLMKENRLIQRATGDNTDLSMNFVPRMSYEELIAGYRWVVRRIYSHQLFYERVIAFLKSYKPVQTGRFRRHSYDVWALLKSMWFLGIRSRGRIYYWKLLLWSLFRRPQLFSLAITLAVQGFHFRKVFAGC